MKKSSVSRTRRFTYFQILCYALERGTRTQHQILFGKKSWLGSRVHHHTELWTQLMVSQWSSSEIFSPDLPLCSSSTMYKSSWPKWAGTNYLHVDVQRHHMGSKDDEQESELTAQLVSIYARRFSPGRWSFLGPGSEKKWYSTHGSRPRGEWDRVAELMMITFSESGYPVFRSTSPLSRGTVKSKGGGKIINTLLRWWGNDWNCFSHDYFCSSAQYLRSSLRFVWGIQCLPSKNGEQDNLTHCLSQQVCWRKTPFPSTNDLEDLLQKYKERVVWLSQQNRVMKIWIDAGFLATVGVGQYFMTQDIEGTCFCEPIKG